ncbi:MAG: hypothetical protein KJP23_10170 [Deltaproteobacteria bacterium]|nr:hypothetical protein [Deltaproteobacteria bacterium]
MSSRELKKLRLSHRDLDFLVETASPEVTDKASLKRIIQEDADFRSNYIGDEKVFRTVIDDDQVMLKISPTLYFEILLRKAARDLSATSYTLEKTLTMSIPVFDTDDLVALLAEESLLVYLADMLSSFTRIESYTVSFRIRKGVWRKIRFNDLDILSLMSFCEIVDDFYRFGLYKRIADICLFMLGVFPEYTVRNYRYPLSGKLRPGGGSSPRINPQDYEKEGRRFYELAAEHASARELEMEDVFRVLHENFQKAKKPLNFIAEHYLQYKRQMIFS